MTSEMADNSNLIRSLIVRAEDARMMENMCVSLTKICPSFNKLCSFWYEEIEIQDQRRNWGTRSTSVHYISIVFFFITRNIIAKQIFLKQLFKGRAWSRATWSCTAWTKTCWVDIEWDRTTIRNCSIVWRLSINTIQRAGQLRRM